MSRKTLLMLSVSVTLATISLAPTALAQFPGPPPMGPGGPPPIAAGGPPAFASPPPMGPGGAPRAGFGGPAPRLGAGAGPRGDLRGAAGFGAAGSGGPAVGYGYGHGGSRYGYRAAYAAGAYAAGAYGRDYSSGSDCYYVYRRSGRVLVCD
jgi:hypothetical protein